MQRIPLEMDRPPVISPVADDVWRLVENFRASIDGCKFDIPAGFATDGASVPRFLWRICGHPLTTNRFPIAVIHDWIYTEYEDMPLTRADADEIYYDGLCDLGFPKWRAWIEYKAIRLFGGSHWQEPEAT